LKNSFTQGGTPDFKCQGRSNGGKDQNPKKSLGLPTKPPKNAMPNEPHISNPQDTSKRDQEFTTAKGNSSDDKAGDKHDG